MRRLFLPFLAAAAAVAWVASPAGPLRKLMGPQPDGTFVVSSGQRVLPGTIAYDQRLSDLALRPQGDVCAVVAKNRVFLVKGRQMVPDSEVGIGANAGFHGVAWTPDGSRLVLSTDAGHLQVYDYSGGKLALGPKVDLKRPGDKLNPVPGGMCVTHDGSRLFVACANFNAVAEVDLGTLKRVRELPVQNLPFTCRLSQDESTLVVTNWGGEPPAAGDRQDESANLQIKVTKTGDAATGTVSLIDLKSGNAKSLEVGLHPTGVAVDHGWAYVANSQSDSVSVIDLGASKVVATWPLKFKGERIIGAMPDELAVRDRVLFACNGGDNALCEIDTRSGEVRGYRPAGYFPTAVQLSASGTTAYVLNTKGNGSVKNSVKNAQKRNAHDFQGTVTVVDLTSNLVQDTARVAELNSWNEPASVYKPKLKVYGGAIKHVVYIIKENRTYDEIFGDLQQGNGDASLCSLGETVMPNHRKLAQTFGLFDNFYVSGTNSADGHQWCDQAMANEYLEHFYVGYSRTYPDDGEDAMALNSTGRVWDAAIKAGKTARVYGEWAGDSQATYEPRAPKDWFEAWDDRVSGRHLFKYKAHTRVNSLKPILCPDYHYWPLILSDQGRVDAFEREFKAFVADGKLPNLIVMSLPSDHSEGTSTKYPTPRSMMADNDLALGRVVELVSHSPYWKETCVFVTEDDAQSGPDHVDGHRSVCLALSPYSKRGVVNSEFATQVNLVRTIEAMLGIKPMNKFDTIARPMTEPFTDRPDFTPYAAAPNNVPLGEKNPSGSQMTALDRFWHDKTASLDWSGMDRADFYWLNRIVWYSLHKGRREYPERAGERPGQEGADDGH